MTVSSQYVLPLPHRVSRDRDDYYVSASNRQALTEVEHWPRWPLRMLAILGPAGSGKTHLACVHAARVEMTGHVLSTDPTAGGPHYLIEGIDARAGDANWEESMFHAFNRASLENGSILFTSRLPLPGIGFALADLRTRMNTVSVVELPPPDDALLLAVLLKLFADRQIDPERAAAVSAWAVPRMPRSLAAANGLVETLDRRSLAEKRRIDTRLAAEILQPDLLL